jgi:hypothetical protein
LEPYLTENSLPVFPDIGRAEGPPMQRKPRWRGASKIGDRFSIPLEMFVELRAGTWARTIARLVPTSGRWSGLVITFL